MAKKNAVSPPTSQGDGPSASDVAIAEKIRAAAKKDPIIGSILSTLFDKGPLMFTKLVEEVHRSTLVPQARIEGKIGDAATLGFIKISEPPLLVCRLGTATSVGVTVIREFSKPDPA